MVGEDVIKLDGIIMDRDEGHMRAGRDLGFTQYLDVAVVALVLSNFILK